MRILLGPSGSGKSVILKLILGLLQADSGTVSVNGQLLSGMSEAQLMQVRSKVGMLFQENALRIVANDVLVAIMPDDLHDVESGAQANKGQPCQDGEDKQAAKMGGANHGLRFN